MNKGTVFEDSFTLLQPIATSVLSRTWLAQNKKAEEVVLKFTKRYPRSRREAQLEENIRTKADQNMVGTTQSFEVDLNDSHFVVEVSEYCPEGDFRKAISHTRDLRKRLELSLGVAKGLQTLHRHSIVHGNVKPENLLVKGGEGKLGDFSLASPLLPGWFVYAGSTLLYLSPENYSGSSYDEQSDIWAFGVVLLEMALGCPLADRSPEEWERPLSSDPSLLEVLLKRVKSINRALGDLLTSILSIDGQRKSMREIVSTLGSILEMQNFPREILHLINLNLSEQELFGMKEDELTQYNQRKKHLKGLALISSQISTEQGHKIYVQWDDETDKVSFKEKNISKISIGYQNLPAIIRNNFPTVRDFIVKMLEQQDQRYYLDSSRTLVLAFYLGWFQKNKVEERQNIVEENEKDMKKVEKSKQETQEIINRMPEEQSLSKYQKKMQEFREIKESLAQNSKIVEKVPKEKVEGLVFDILRLQQKKPPDQSALAIKRYELGKVYYDNKKYQSSIKEYQKCQQLLSKTQGMGAYFVKVGHAFGLSYFSLNKYDKAREKLVKAREHLTNMKKKGRVIDEVQQIQIEIDLAKNYLQDGSKQESIGHLMYAEELWSQSKAKSYVQLILILISKANVLMLLNEPEAAVKWFNEALSKLPLSKELVPQIVNIKFKIVSCLLALKSYHNVVQQFKESFNLLRQFDMIKGQQFRKIKEQSINTIAHIYTDVDENTKSILIDFVLDYLPDQTMLKEFVLSAM